AVAVRQRLQHHTMDHSVDRCSRSDTCRKRGGRQEQHSFSAAPRPPCLGNDHAALCTDGESQTSRMPVKLFKSRAQNVRMNYGQAFSPPCNGGVAAPLTKWIRSKKGADGVVSSAKSSGLTISPN